MNEFDEIEYIMDKEMMEDRDFADFMDFVEEVCKENEQLKQEIENGMESFKRIQRCHTLTLVEENEQLKSEINGLEELLKSYRKTIKHDAELLADASKKGYLPPLKNWREL